MMDADQFAATPLAAPPRTRPERRRRITMGGVLLVLFCLAAVAAGQLVAYTRDDEIDRWQYAYFGQRILAGDAMYADVWDVKPPIQYWLAAAGLWIADGRDTGILAGCAAASLISLLLLYVACRAFASPRAAGVTTALGAFFLSHVYFFGGSNRSETSEVLFELAAFALFAHSRRTRRTWMLIAAGISAGAALGAKQTAVALILALLTGAVIGIVRAHDARGRAVGRLFALIIGTGVGVAAWLWPTLHGSDWRVVYDALVGFPRLHTVGAGQTVPRPHLMPLRPLLALLCVPIVLAAVAFVHSIVVAATSARTERQTNVAGSLVPVLCVWWVLGVLLISVAPHEHPHYWLPTIVPLLLLAGVTIHRMLRDDTFIACIRGRPGVLVAAVALAILAWPAIRLQRDRIITAWADATEPHEPSLAERVAQAARANDIPPGPVLVWGHAPEIYWRLGRPPASRFIGTHYFYLPNGAGQPYFDEMMSQLDAAPPPLIVLPESPDELTTDAQTMRLDVSPFVHLLSEYEASTEVDGITLYRRRVAQSSSG